MTQPMHDLLESAIDRKVESLADCRTFADAHQRRLGRSIATRRVASRAGVGVAAVVAAGAVTYGVVELTQGPGPLAPAAQPFPFPGTFLQTELVPLELGNDEYDLSFLHAFYVTLGTTEMRPFPASGFWYPGIPDVPADAMIVSVRGDEDGFEFGPNEEAVVDLMFASNGEGDESPRWNGASFEPSPWFTVLGEVSSETRWGVRVYYVNDTPVTIAEAHANPDAVEVTAWYTPEEESAAS